MTELRVALAAYVVVCAGQACAGDGPGGVVVRPPVEVRTAAITETSSLVRTLEVGLAGPMGIEVDYWTAAAPRLRVSRPNPAENHRVLLARLWPESVYEYEVRAVTPEGARGDPLGGEFVTGPLPSSLAEVRFMARGEPTVHLFLLELRGPPFGAFVIVDRDGQVVWYWPAAHAQGAARLPRGDFVFLDNDSGLVAVSPSRQVLGRLVQDRDGRNIHHDVMPTSDRSVLFLANERRSISDTVWVGEAMWEWDVDLGAAHRVWNAFDFLNPTDDRGSRSVPVDWLHANAISFGPRGNIILSLHFLDQLISVAPRFDAIEWRLGGTQSDFRLDAAAIFSGQHTPAEVAPWRIVMFDNGFARSDGSLYSRALEISVDTATHTASRAWEFRPSVDNFARIISSARRLENGNTVVAFGTSAGVVGTSTGPIEVYEVEQSGRVVWHLLVEGAESMYRATPLNDVAGERVVLESDEVAVPIMYPNPGTQRPMS